MNYKMVLFTSDIVCLSFVLMCISSCPLYVLQRIACKRFSICVLFHHYCGVESAKRRVRPARWKFHPSSSSSSKGIEGMFLPSMFPFSSSILTAVLLSSICYLKYAVYFVGTNIESILRVDEVK